MMSKEVIDELRREGIEMRNRHMREQQTEDLVMKALFVAMCPLLFPILFMND